MARDREDRGGNKGNSSSVFAFQTSDEFRTFAKNYRTPLASGMASIISTAVAFPLDFAKSRMQSYNTKFVPTLREAYRAEGLRGFWRGVGPPLASVTLVRTISFTLYQKAKYKISEGFRAVTGESPLDIANEKGRYPTLSTTLCFGLAGAAAGSAVTVVACPFELTKLHAQLAGKMVKDTTPGGKQPSAADLKTGAWRTAKQLVRERGFGGLYCGYRLHLLRDTIGTSIYFMTYESAKQIFGNARGASPTSPFAVMAGGGLCGIVSWICTYPVDVAKTVYQKSLLASKGNHVPPPRIEFFKHGSYRGLGVSLMRSALINMIFFSNFELIKKRINAFSV